MYPFFAAKWRGVLPSLSLRWIKERKDRKKVGQEETGGAESHWRGHSMCDEEKDLGNKLNVIMIKLNWRSNKYVYIY